ncbi:MAG: hypothetical protein ACKO0V_19710 [bacterium]
MIFRKDKIVINLQKLESLCKRRNGNVQKDKLKAIDPATGEFGVSAGGGGFFGKGRSKDDSITGPLGNQIILFFAFVKQHAYKRILTAAETTEQVATLTHVKNAFVGLKRMARYTYAGDQAKYDRLNQIIGEVEALFQSDLRVIDFNHWGHRALEAARSTRLHKSANKAYLIDLQSQDNQIKNRPSPNKFQVGGQEITGPDRLKEARRRIGGLRTMYDGAEEADFAAVLGAGNCGELSKIAFNFLHMHGIFPIARFCLESPGDHVFLAMGGDFNDIRDLASRVANRPLTKSNLRSDFADWPNETYICDPWANIFCKAHAYPLEFLNKMQKWSQVGKQVFYINQWIDPMTNGYPHSVAVCDKRCADVIM